MVNRVSVDAGMIFKLSAERSLLHLEKCPVIKPMCKKKFTHNYDVMCYQNTTSTTTVEFDDAHPSDEEQEFRDTAEILSGKTKCIKTCIFACCQELDFVLLYILSVQIENKRRCIVRDAIQNNKTYSDFEGALLNKILRKDMFNSDGSKASRAISLIKKAKEKQLVKNIFYDNYNPDSDSVVFLFESDRLRYKTLPEMSVQDLNTAIAQMSHSTETGPVFNINDSRFSNL